MLINLGDLSESMGMIFMRDFMTTAKHMACEDGQLLFQRGDATLHFYTLIQGEFQLTIGTKEQHVYTVYRPGDIFGWSSLVGGGTYSATAVCTKISDILRFDHSRLLNLLGKHPDCGFLFFRKLAEVLGKRLLKSYQIIQSNDILGYAHNDYLALPPTH